MQKYIDISTLNGTLDECITLTEEQAQAILYDIRAQMMNKKKKQSRQKRKAINFSRYPFSKWDKIHFPIRYKFDGGHGKKEFLFHNIRH